MWLENTHISQMYCCLIRTWILVEMSLNEWENCCSSPGFISSAVHAKISLLETFFDHDFFHFSFIFARKWRKIAKTHFKKTSINQEIEQGRHIQLFLCENKHLIIYTNPVIVISRFWLSSSTSVKYVYFQATVSTVIGGREINRVGHGRPTYVLKKFH